MCLLTRLIKPDGIKFQWRQFITLAEGAQPVGIMACEPVSFVQEVQNDDSGVSYKQTFSAVTAEPAVMDFDRSAVVIEITLSDGTVRYMGTKGDPVLLMVTPYPDRYVVSCEAAAANPVEL